MATERSLDRKLNSILDGRYEPSDFIIADAKDADMAFGVAAAGRRRAADGPAPVAADAPPAPGVFRTRHDYLQDMAAEIEAGAVDIMLTSVSNGEALADAGLVGLGSDSAITLACRGNDTTDIWNQRAGGYPSTPSQPFRTANLHAMREFCDLVLYSVTFTNDVDRDLATVQAYREFRHEAADTGVRHFLEVFNPNVPCLPDEQVGAFVNDSIVRLLAGVTRAERPIFLKMAYNGAGAVAELVEHDPSLVLGILGGSAGTTRDTLELLSRAERAGARVALFGRKIQQAESQLDLLRVMRSVLSGEQSPEQGVRSYHAALDAAGLAPGRDLQTDLGLSDPVLLAESRSGR